MDSQSRTVTLSVAGRPEVSRRAVVAMAGEPQGEHITFASIELLWKVLSPNRLALLRAMAGKGGMSIREAARRVGRDVKAVHGDIHALLAAGILDRDEAGRILFPYDRVHVDFMLNDAA